MNRINVKGIPITKQVGGAVLGLLCGLLTPATLSLSAICLVTPMLIPILWAWSGLAGAVALTLAALFSMQGGALGVAVVALIAPGWFTAILIVRRTRFYKGLTWAVCAQWLCLFCCVLMLWFPERTSVVDRFTAVVAYWLRLLPEDAARQVITLLDEGGLLGTAFVAGGLEYGELLTGAMDALGSEMKLALPVTLIRGGATTAILGDCLALRICQKRGDEPPVSLAPLKAWYLTPNLILGPSACALVAWLLDAAGLDGAEAAYIAMLGLAFLLFAIQGMAALERRMTAVKLPASARACALVALALLVPTVLTCVGITSALFGGRGLVARRRARQNNGDHKDEGGVS